MVVLDSDQIFTQRIRDPIVGQAGSRVRKMLTRAAREKLTDFQSKIVHQITRDPSRIRSPTTFLSGSAGVGRGISITSRFFSFSAWRAAASAARSCETARIFS